MRSVFLDTYALFEIVLGNPAFEQYDYDLQITTTRLNLLELYYGLLCRYGRPVADYYYSHFLPYAAEFSDDAIKHAALFRQANAGKRLSFIDCIGYAVAALAEVPFVTGDSAFKGMPNVEFVK